MAGVSSVSLLSAFSSANRGPLTTVFTPPGSCLTETTILSYLSTPSTTSATSNITATEIFINHHTWGDSSCYPSTILTSDGYTKWNNNYYYSPGICPSGWTSACQQTTNPAGNPISQGPETTAVLCCPSNWSCLGGTTSNSHACMTILSAGQTLTSVWIPSPTPTPNVPLNISSNRSYTTWEISTQTTALCDGVPILWQKTDLAILSLLGSTISSTQTTPLSATIPPATGMPTTTPNGSPAGLSPGAKAAIGVTIPIVFLAALLGTFFYFRRRNARKQDSQPDDEPDLHITRHEMSAPERHEMSTPASDHKHWSWSPLQLLKKHAKPPVEADPDSAVVPELEGGTNIVPGLHELPADLMGLPELAGNRSDHDGPRAESGNHDHREKD